MSVLGENNEVGECESCADNPHRHAFLIKFLQDCRAADEDVGLAGSEGRVESRDRGIGFGVKLEAILGVETARLHDVPDQRIEHRQRQTRNLDDRLLLRVRWRSADGRDRKSKRGKAAARYVEHGHFPLVVNQPVILRVTWLEGDCDFTPLSFACK